MPSIEPLRRVVAALERASLRPPHGGSGLLLAHGLVGQVRDWDLLVDADLAQVERALSDAHLAWTDAADRSGRYATTARLLLNIDAVEIDLMVGFAIWPEGASHNDLPIRIPALPAGIWQGIQLGSLEAWLVAYRLMARPEKPDLIAGSLAANGVNADYLERMLAEPLPDAILDIVEQLRTVGDNHSFVLLPDQQNALSESSGFGMMVGGTQVLMVYPDGPAYRAGVRAGDLIETLDGQPFLSMPYQVDPARLGGFDPNSPWGISAELTLRGPGVTEPITVTVEQGPYSNYVPPTGNRLPGDIGYLAVPHYLSPDREAEYATTASDIIADVDQDPTCGWVVDLRLDGGGSYSPMISGVGPILGNGTFAGFQSADGIQNWVAYRDGRITQDGYEVSDYLAEQGVSELQRPNPPVAVLTGPNTASSGEVTTLAFVGRPDTRSFGETTAGATTANQSFPLFDGTRLILAAAAMTDRTGATHLDGVAPDEWVSNHWTAYGTDEDPVLNAAIDWLNQQPACTTDAATPE